MSTGDGVEGRDHRATDRPGAEQLGEVTAALTTSLGSPDPDERDATALPTLVQWVADGVYDDLLPGLGDGMATGLSVGLGESGTPSVLRRAGSVQVLAAVVRRDNAKRLVRPEEVFAWGDAVFTWFVREKDLRERVGAARAEALAHGADALEALAASPHLDTLGLTVLLDVVADRLLLPSGRHAPATVDRLARSVVRVLATDRVPLTVVEPWVARLADPADHPADDPVATSVQDFLRSLHVALLLGEVRFEHRSDLLLSLATTLRRTNPTLLGRTR